MIKRSSAALLAAGVLIFSALLAWHGPGSGRALLWAWRSGLLPVLILFHALPLTLDALAMQVLLRGPASALRRLRACLLGRWVGESVSSLMPFGQLAAPVVIARYLRGAGLAEDQAISSVTVSSTLQAIAQIGFALIGLAVLGTHVLPASLKSVEALVVGGCLLLGAAAALLYRAQRRGLFAAVLRAVTRFTRRRPGAALEARAAAADAAVERSYRHGGRAAACLLLNFAAWLAGAGETWLALRSMRVPVDVSTALMLESLGQAVRGVAFAIPGALGIQEGGYVLLAPLAAINAPAALALSLIKRARELLLGGPGLLLLALKRSRAR